MDSMQVNRGLVVPERIVIVDDVLTKGAMLLASASLLAEAFPGSNIRAPAFVRTLGLVPDTEQVVQPCVWTIIESYSEAERNP